MRKGIAVLMLVSAVLFSGCSSDDSGYTKQDVTIDHVKEPLTTIVQDQSRGNADGLNLDDFLSSDSYGDIPKGWDQDDIWSSDGNEVNVSVVKMGKYSATEVVSVEVNGLKKEFNWSVVEEPRIYYTDLTGDDKPEVLIIYNTGRGTGLSIDELHVLNSDDLSEIKVPNYEEVVADIESQVIKAKDGKLTIKVKAQGKDYEFSNAVDPEQEVQDKLLFGGTIGYGLKKQTILSNFGASVGTSPIYLCQIYASYKFDSAKNEFVVDQIRAMSFE